MAAEIGDYDPPGAHFSVGCVRPAISASREGSRNPGRGRATYTVTDESEEDSEWKDEDEIIAELVCTQSDDDQSTGTNNQGGVVSTVRKPRDIPNLFDPDSEDDSGEINNKEPNERVGKKNASITNPRSPSGTDMHSLIQRDIVRNAALGTAKKSNRSSYNFPASGRGKRGRANYAEIGDVAQAISLGFSKQADVEMKRMDFEAQLKRELMEPERKKLEAEERRQISNERRQPLTQLQTLQRMKSISSGEALDDAIKDTLNQLRNCKYCC